MYSNYDACSAALSTLFAERPTDYLDVAQHYHGARSPYYAWLVRVGTMVLGLGIWTPDLGIGGGVTELVYGVKTVFPKASAQ
jgi:hypothetical protein